MANRARRKISSLGSRCLFLAVDPLPHRYRFSRICWENGRSRRDETKSCCGGAKRNQASQQCRRLLAVAVSHHAVTLGGVPQRRNRIDRKGLVLKEPGKTYHMGPIFTGGHDWPSGAYNPKTNVMPLQNLCFDTTPRADRDPAPQFVYNARPAWHKDKAGRRCGGDRQTLRSYARDELLARARDCRRPRVQRILRSASSRARR
jgi:hypothetical protein